MSHNKLYNFIGGVSVNFSALKVHMSEDAHEALLAFPEFITECRGDITVKVKTIIPVYYSNEQMLSCNNNLSKIVISFY